jgi:hypothetical protein
MKALGSGYSIQSKTAKTAWCSILHQLSVAE